MPNEFNSPIMPNPASQFLAEVEGSTESCRVPDDEWLPLVGEFDLPPLDGAQLEEFRCAVARGET